MAFHVRDPGTDRAVRALAKALGVGLTDAVRTACEAELKRLAEALPLAERIKPLRAQMGLKEKGAAVFGPLPAPPADGSSGPVFVPGELTARIMIDEAAAAAWCPRIERARGAFSSHHATHRAATLLMQHAGISVGRSAQAVDGFASLARLKLMPTSDVIYAEVLSLRHAITAAQGNEMPSEDELMEEAFCRQFRYPIELLGVAQRIPHGAKNFW